MPSSSNRWLSYWLAALAVIMAAVGVVRAQSVNTGSSIQVQQPSGETTPGNEIEDYYSGDITNGDIGKTGDAIRFQAWEVTGALTFGLAGADGLVGYQQPSPTPETTEPPGRLWAYSGQGPGGFILQADAKNGSTGTGYLVGDMLTLTRNVAVCGFVAGTDAIVEVLTIGGAGEVLTVEEVNRGTNYENGCEHGVTGGAGAGARIITTQVQLAIGGGTLFRPYDPADAKFGLGLQFNALSGTWRRRWRVIPSNEVGGSDAASSFAYGFGFTFPVPMEPGWNLPVSYSLNPSGVGGAVFLYASGPDGGSLSGTVTLTVDTAGTGYTVNDILYLEQITNNLSGITGKNGWARVTSTNGGGGLTGVSIENAGYGWNNANAVDVLGGTGTGAKLDINGGAQGGPMRNWMFSNGASGVPFDAWPEFIPSGAQPGAGVGAFALIFVVDTTGKILNEDIPATYFGAPSGNAGSGYAVNDTGHLSLGDGLATYVIDSVDGSGAITGYHLTALGSGYVGVTTALGINPYPILGGADWFTLELGRNDGEALVRYRVYDSTGAPLMDEATSTFVPTPEAEDLVSFFEMSAYLCPVGSALSSGGVATVIDKTETRFTDQNRDPAE